MLVRRPARALREPSAGTVPRPAPAARRNVWRRRPAATRVPLSHLGACDHWELRRGPPTARDIERARERSHPAGPRARLPDRPGDAIGRERSSGVGVSGPEPRPAAEGAERATRGARGRVPGSARCGAATREWHKFAARARARTLFAAGSASLSLAPLRTAAPALAHAIACGSRSPQTARTCIRSTPDRPPC